MPKLIETIIIAFIQGLTEWLPVSSSGHLVLAEKFLNQSPSLTLQVALHFGTLMSVFVYFGKDITDILQDILRFRFKTENGKLGIFIIIATIPAAIAGFLLKNTVSSILTNLTITTISFGITGLLLIIASFPQKTNPKKLNHINSLIIGISQIFTIFPGISRSGTTISTGLLLGLKEKTALKFSFLMSIPIIFGANILVIGNQTLPPELIWATLVSFIVGLITIHLLYKHILTSRKNLRYFGFYALTLSLTLTIIILTS
jgi:undecaprenyl-diphosphatase